MKSAAQLEPPVAAEAPAAEVRRGLYQPLDFFMIRAPLLPVECYRDLTDQDRQLALLSDERVRRALLIGSASLAGAVERFKASELTRRDAGRMQAKLLRYLIRMSTRPTPYGLFAGVSTGGWGEVTDLRVLSTSARTRTRPDMAWMIKLVMDLEADPAIRRRLTVTANPLLYREANRFFLAGRAHSSQGQPGIPVSIRATTIVSRVLERARVQAAYEDLVEDLLATSATATREKIEALLNQLLDQTFLLADLRPPLTSDDVAGALRLRLAGLPEAAEALKKLDSLLNAASDWDSRKESEAAFASMLFAAGIPPDGSQPIPVQADMAMSVNGRMGKRVAEEAARAAELLLRLSPAPRGISSLANYRQRFIGKYGHEREVPLCEMLHADRGLGPATGYNYSLVAPDPGKAAQRSRVLLQLACSALRDRLRVVELDEAHLDQLETWKPDRDTALLSLDLNILVAARSKDAIDRGEFSIAVGPNLGAQAGGRNLARFADVIGPTAREALRQVASAELAHAPEDIWAEIVYLPTNPRLANVVIRPAIREYEIALGATPSVAPERVIPADELVVGVEANRFYVRWPAAGKRVRFCSGHMLSHRSAPPLVSFLTDLANDSRVAFTSFDWGPAEGFDYLPRVQAGRIVLRPAQWRLNKATLRVDSAQDFGESLADWRKRWDVSRHVCLSNGDNRLTLDLDREFEAAELRAELRKLKEESLVLQELFPALDEAWLEGSEGHYYSELVVTLALRPAANSSPKPASSRERPRSLPATHVRLHPPGSRWLFVKLYCPKNLEDEIVPESMLTLAENALAAGWAESWFYIRYSDPEPHIRLRFSGPPDKLTRGVFPEVCSWANELIAGGLAIKLVFDSYEQELERFGGAGGMEAAEAIFAADSRCAAKLLRLLKTQVWPHDKTTLLAASVDLLLEALGMDAAERLTWYRNHSNARASQVGNDYRKRKNVLRSVVGHPQQFFSALKGGQGLADVFAEREKLLAQIIVRLSKLASAKTLTQPLETLCSSFVHLHLNRMSSPDSPEEQHLLSLLCRTHESLDKAPLRGSAALPVSAGA